MKKAGGLDATNASMHPRRGDRFHRLAEQPSSRSRSRAADDRRQPTTSPFAGASAVAGVRRARPKTRPSINQGRAPVRLIIKLVEQLSSNTCLLLLSFRRCHHISPQPEPAPRLNNRITAQVGACFRFRMGLLPVFCVQHVFCFRFSCAAQHVKVRRLLDPWPLACGRPGWLAANLNPVGPEQRAAQARVRSERLPSFSIAS